LTKHPEKILFLAEGQLGDNIILGPALRAVKQTYPDCEVSVLLMHRRRYSKDHERSPDELPSIEKSSFTGTAEVFKDHPYTDNILELDRKSLRRLKGIKRLKAELGCIRYLRKEKFSAVICTFPQERFIIWSFLAGIKKRIGEKNQKMSYLLTDKPDICRKDSGVLKYFCNLLVPLGVKCDFYQTFFNIPEASQKFAQGFFKEHGFTKGKNIIAIHPGASSKGRQMPPAFYTELINLLNDAGYKDIILCYSEYDLNYTKELKQGLPNHPVEIQTRTISDLAAILNLSSVVIVHNSGPRHLAAAMGLKVLGILQDYDDIMWKIYDDIRQPVIQANNPCDNCKRDGKCFGYIPKGDKYGAKCMNSIKAVDVYSRVVSLLNNN